MFGIQITVRIWIFPSHWRSSSSTDSSLTKSEWLPSTRSPHNSRERICFLTATSQFQQLSRFLRVDHPICVVSPSEPFGFPSKPSMMRVFLSMSSFSWRTADFPRLPITFLCIVLVDLAVACIKSHDAPFVGVYLPTVFPCLGFCHIPGILLTNSVKHDVFAWYISVVKRWRDALTDS